MPGLKGLGDLVWGGADRKVREFTAEEFMLDYSFSCVAHGKSLVDNERNCVGYNFQELHLQFQIEFSRIILVTISERMVIALFFSKA